MSPGRKSRPKGPRRPHDSLPADASQRRKGEGAFSGEAGRALDLLPAFVYILGPDRTILYSNRRFRELFGDPEGRSCHAVLAGAGGPCEQCPAWAEQPRGETWTRVWTDFRGRMFRAEVVPLPGDSKLLLGVGAQMDCKGQRVSSVQGPGDDFRTIFEASRDPILLLNAERIITDANTAFLNLFGYCRGEVVGHSVRMIHPDQSHYVLFGEMAYPEMARSGAWRGEWAYQRKDGGIIRLETVLSHLPHEDGADTVYLAIMRDMTENARVKENLRRQKAYFEQLVENSPEAIAVLDLNGMVQRINTEFTKLFGYTPQEAQGRLLDDLVGNLQNMEEARELCRRAFRGERIHLETRRRRSDGSLLDVSLLAAPVVVDGRLTGVYSIYRDISSRKREEARRELLEEQLKQAQKMEALGTLAGGIAHDFNNILGAILGYCELLAGDIGANPQAEASLQSIITATERGRNLVNQILTFSRRAATEKKPLNLNKPVVHAVEMLQSMLPRMVRLDMSQGGDLPPVWGDMGQLEQVVVNLGMNAADAMPRGGRVMVETMAGRVEEAPTGDPSSPRPGDYVLLRVTDQGLGMSPEVQEKIFDPFFTTKGPGKGTGLGLAMVFGIVEGHGGHISCRSRPGEGSVFTIHLPVAEEGPLEEPLPVPSPETEGPTESLTILLVDDEEPLLEIGRRALEAKGHTVVTANSGEEALDIYRKRMDEFQAVVLDVSMPGMGGYRCFEAIKALNPEAWIVVASGYLMGEGEQVSELRSRASAFIQKPFRQAELLAVLRQARK